MIIVIFILCSAFAFILVWLLTREWGDNSAQSTNFKFNLGPMLNKSVALFGKDIRSRIIFNGKEYASPEEMPPDVRQAYNQAIGIMLADANQNGIPDIFEGGGNTTVMQTGMFTKTSEDPAGKIEKLKDMRDSGLITAEEYEKKKAEVLERM